MTGTVISKTSKLAVNPADATQNRALVKSAAGAAAKLMGQARKAFSNIQVSMGSKLNPARICYKAPNRLDEINDNLLGDVQKAKEEFEAKGKEVAECSKELRLISEDIKKQPDKTSEECNRLKLEYKEGEENYNKLKKEEDELKEIYIQQFKALPPPKQVELSHADFVENYKPIYDDPNKEHHKCRDSFDQVPDAMEDSKVEVEPSNVERLVKRLKAIDKKLAERTQDLKIISGAIKGPVGSIKEYDDLKAIYKEENEKYKKLKIKRENLLHKIAPKVFNAPPPLKRINTMGSFDRALRAMELSEAKTECFEFFDAESSKLPPKLWPLVSPLQPQRTPPPLPLPRRKRNHQAQEQPASTEDKRTREAGGTSQISPEDRQDSYVERPEEGEKLAPALKVEKTARGEKNTP
ncbi:hypothetical protein [Microbulbifer sp. JMSA003]|uniref:hypothetical protein n=1 Tax=unclassified Microbulbifer TaxID=2619833 RepID=UPI00403A4042